MFAALALAIPQLHASDAQPAPDAERAASRFASVSARSLIRAAEAVDRRAHGGASAPTIRLSSMTQRPLRSAPSLDGWLRHALRSASEQRTAAGRTASLREIEGSLRLAASDARQSYAAKMPRIDPHKAVRTILAAPAYRQLNRSATSSRGTTLAQRFSAWLARLLEKVFRGLDRVASHSAGLGDALAALLEITAAAALIVFVYRLGRALSRRRPRRRDERRGVQVATRPDADALYRESLAAAGRADYAKAIALLFQTCLLALDRNGKASYDPAQTVGQYRLALARSAEPWVCHFDALARAFTVASYARLPAGADDWAHARAAYRALSAARTD
ncbi:MAG: hypothetical protein GIW99_05325 [Candidatus Eremiobacteraeota bacterium]|nr:hypothetical protein [Candidatus Eremiobacteraeota bacterium]MBC5827088.1 hypothetical protein [Candidatus Eremiobacteraeota bacterium]